MAAGFGGEADLLEGVEAGPEVLFGGAGHLGGQFEGGHGTGLAFVGVVFVDGGVDIVEFAQHGLDLEAGALLELCDGDVVEGAGHGDGEEFSEAVDGEYEAFEGDFFGDQFDDLAVDADAGEVDGGDAGLSGEELVEVVFVEVSEADEDFEGLAALALLYAECFVELVAGDESFLEQEFADEFLGGRQLGGGRGLLGHGSAVDHVRVVLGNVDVFGAAHALEGFAHGRCGHLHFLPACAGDNHSSLIVRHDCPSVRLECRPFWAWRSWLMSRLLMVH